MQLQLNGRNFTQLITLVPGVSNQTGQDEGVVGAEGSISYSVNGGRTEYNNWEVDGGDMMDNGSNFSLNVYPSVEAIDEVQVLTSNYGAQYGKNGSGTVEVETKSGTNRVSRLSCGSLRGTRPSMRTTILMSPELPKAGYKKHDFGYSIGGPDLEEPHILFLAAELAAREVPYNFYSLCLRMANRPRAISRRLQCTSPPERFRGTRTDCPVPDIKSESIITGNPYDPESELASVIGVQLTIPTGKSC